MSKSRTRTKEIGSVFPFPLWRKRKKISRLFVSSAPCAAKKTSRGRRSPSGEQSRGGEGILVSLFLIHLSLSLPSGLEFACVRSFVNPSFSSRSGRSSSLNFRALTLIQVTVCLFPEMFVNPHVPSWIRPLVWNTLHFSISGDLSVTVY